MDEVLVQWLVYLEGRQSDLESNRRSRTPLIFAIGTLFIGSILYLDSGGDWLVGSAGMVVAAVFAFVLYHVITEESWYVATLNRLIKMILIGQLSDSREVNKELNLQTFPGLRRYVKGEIERRLNSWKQLES